jgi:hypothetical protein
METTKLIANLLERLKATVTLYHRSTTDSINARAQGLDYCIDDQRVFSAFAVLEHRLRPASRLPQ